MLSHERQKLYDDLEDRVKGSPLVEYEGAVPRGNRILIKMECDGDLGGYYNRTYVELFKHYESTGKIVPGQPSLESTSGTAGRPFAIIGRALGYDCYVMLPAGGEPAREEALKDELVDDDHLILTPPDDYISGFPKQLKQYLTDHPDVFFLNHSMGKGGTDNEATLQGMGRIADEIPPELLDRLIFVSGVGNGSNTKGIGRRLKQLSDGKIPVEAFETMQDPVAYFLKLGYSYEEYPDAYRETFGIEPGTVSRHRFPGLSYHGIPFPHIRSAVDDRVIDGVHLISDKEGEEEYSKLTGREFPFETVRWDAPISEYQGLGKSTIAALNVALRQAETESDKVFLIIGYDYMKHYGPA